MTVLVVVNHARDWPFEIEGARVVTARQYLTGAVYTESQSARIINLCRTDRYQSRGYYVSLLAEARGHRVLPDVKTPGELHGPHLDRLLGAAFIDNLQRTLAGCDGNACGIDAWFGHDPSGRNEPIAQQLFAVLRIPLLQAQFERDGGRWRFRSVRIVSPNEIPAEQQPLLVEAASAYIGRGSRVRAPQQSQTTPSIAILFDADEPEPPSNAAALDKFKAAAETLGMRPSFIGRGDIDGLDAFDALFIRDTTAVNHYTYQFARRAAAAGLIVVDDPESILKCTNKVYLNELLTRHKVPVPKTLMVHHDNVDQIVPLLGLPCILKQPDSAFSLGVTKVESESALRDCLQHVLARSDLAVAQEWLPTPFDWRVGVFDRRPLYVCKYFMAAGHWQVVKRESGRKLEGSTVALSVGEAPDIVVRTAVRAANLIGDGLYGVDLKEDGQQCYVMEVNDNPNLDAGNEDGVLKDALYREVMGVFARRIRERKRAAP